MLTEPSSSRRRSWLRRRSSPAAMRPATTIVGLVSPRSTWESIGALTPLRSARSRSDRSIASRRARTRGPSGASSVVAAIRPYVIAYGRLLSTEPLELALEHDAPSVLEQDRRGVVALADPPRGQPHLEGRLLVAAQRGFALGELDAHDLAEALAAHLDE